MSGWERDGGPGEPYRGHMLPREAGAELARLRREDEDRLRAGRRRGLGRELAAAGSFSGMGVCLSLAAGAPPLLAAAWVLAVCGVWAVGRIYRGDPA